MNSEAWDAVRQRAHELWLEEGCPDGRSETHWQQAQREVLEKSNAAPSSTDEPIVIHAADALPCASEELEAQPDLEEAYLGRTSTDPAMACIQPPAKGTSLFKIRSRQCRFIVSEAPSPTIFCGAPIAGASSWCTVHRARVFVRSAAQTGQRKATVR